MLVRVSRRCLLSVLADVSDDAVKNESAPGHITLVFAACCGCQVWEGYFSRSCICGGQDAPFSNKLELAVVLEDPASHPSLGNAVSHSETG